MIRRITGLFSLILLAAATTACGGDSASQGGTPAADTAPSPAPPAAATDQPPASDSALASTGEALFTQRACNACHTIGGGRLVGPDLTGVTDRRTYEWIVSMITKPDSMIRDDPTAKQLFGEYMTPMANQNVTREEASALYQFLRRSSGS